MEYGICQLSIIPGRAEPADQSEIVTQLLFGDHYKIIDTRKKWAKVRMGYDKYECWIDAKQVHMVSEEEYLEFHNYSGSHVALDLVNVLANGEDMMPIVVGSTLPSFADGKSSVQDQVYEYGGETRELNWNVTKDKITEYAYMYLNAPYLWGGRTPFGIDCSGYSQIVYKLAGKQIPRDASQQAELGQTLSFIEEAVPGDLAFFDNEEGNIIHVGIMLEDNHIIHASGKVRVDRIDHQGIYNDELRDYSHKLRIIKRIID